MGRISSYLFIFLVFSVGLLYAGAIRNRPTAFPDPTSDGQVIIKWQTDDESNVQQFQVVRATVFGGRKGDFDVTVATINHEALKGNLSFYEVIDKGAFKTSGNVFVYKIRVVFKNGSISDSEEATTAVLSSTARRTWGSIKAMFR